MININEAILGNFATKDYCLYKENIVGLNSYNSFIYNKINNSINDKTKISNNNSRNVTCVEKYKTMVKQVEDFKSNRF